MLQAGIETNKSIIRSFERSEFQCLDCGKKYCLLLFEKDCGLLNSWFDKCQHCQSENLEKFVIFNRDLNP